MTRKRPLCQFAVALPTHQYVLALRNSMYCNATSIKSAFDLVLLVFGQDTRSVWAEHSERLGRTLYQYEKDAHDNIHKKGAIMMSFFKQFKIFNIHIFIKALNKLHFYIYLQNSLTTEFSFINNIYN